MDVFFYDIILPMLTYFPLVVVFFQCYVKGAGISTVAATMLPYSIVFMIGWTALLIKTATSATFVVMIQGSSCLYAGPKYNTPP